jgi:hypothetical protein
MLSHDLTVLCRSLSFWAGRLMLTILGGRRKTGAISFPEGADQGIAVLAAELAVLLAVSHNCHLRLLLQSVSPAFGAGGL